jgi:hypothetical protein
MPEIDDSHADDSSLDSSAPTFAAVAQPSYARTLFLDAGGLRPGWGIVFYFLMYYGLQRLVGL